MNTTELTLVNSPRKAVIDQEDLPKVRVFNWFLATNGYVVANRYDSQIYLHRFLMGEPDGRVDHKDRDPLNNTSTNLRLASHAQNLANSGPRKGKRFKGVHATREGRFRACICVNRKQRQIGTYKTEEEAAKAYNEAALAAWGEFAFLNPV